MNKIEELKKQRQELDKQIKAEETNEAELKKKYLYKRVIITHRYCEGEKGIVSCYRKTKEADFISVMLDIGFEVWCNISDVVFYQPDMCVNITVGENESDKTKWISVKDNLPPDSERVLMCFDRKTVHEGWHADSGWYRCTNINTSVEKLLKCSVTHWQPLPKPPKY